MTDGPSATDWITLSGSKIGSVHTRDELPLQDAVLTWRGNGHAVLAVADGHGHHAHFRSDTGAALAVVSANEELRRRLPQLAEADAEGAEALAAEAGRAIVETWTAKVEHHRHANPYDDQTTADSLLPYGTTMLSAAVAGDHLVFVQIGDGDSVVVGRDGEASLPLPVDPDLDGPFTTSLCQPDPVASMRVARVATSDVALAFLCSDGFGRPQADPDWWRQTGAQLARFGRERGWEWVGEQLPEWLAEPAQVGGDDTTMAILARKTGDGPARQPS